jgi:hypothetical protein
MIGATANLLRVFLTWTEVKRRAKSMSVVLIAEERRRKAGGGLQKDLAFVLLGVMWLAKETQDKKPKSAKLGGHPVPAQ